jgi:hypothetical protein
MAFLPIEDRPLDRWVAAFFRSAYSPTIFKWKKFDKPPVYFATEPSQIVPTVPTQEPKIAKGPAFLSNLEDAESSLLGKITSLFGGTQKSPVSAPQSAAQASSQFGEAGSHSEQPAEIFIPKAPPIQAPPQPSQQQVYKSPVPAVPVTAAPVSQTLSPAISQNQVVTPQFSNEASPPSPPTQPNVVVGQVMDANGKIVEGAILEIKDPQLRPVRALRSNKVGHFLIVTPLNNGTYELGIEKEGLQFDLLKIEATGEIIPPIAIRAKNAILPLPK